MMFKSTRGAEQVSASYAILHGLATDGGLYIPERMPKIEAKDYLDKTYQEIAVSILSLFFDEFTTEELQERVDKAYSPSNFSHEKITGIREVKGNKAYLELFYGQTLAFKDQALSLYPHLLLLAKKYQKEERELLILAATSGDTGKAAMEAVKDIAGIKIIVLYPTDGVSSMQKEQMQKQMGNNVFPIGIKGNFDDAQNVVKRVFSDNDIQALAAEHNMLLTSANSINVARLLPQVIYYLDAYVRLVNDGLVTVGDEINITVPTGNFGNILAAFIAKKIGVPIGKVICATNENNVLADFIRTGRYDIRDRAFLVTHSPSMDILISSNLERFLSLLFPDTAKIKGYMESLQQDKFFELTAEELVELQQHISAYDTSNKQTIQTIADVYQAENYLIDPHTSVAAYAEERYAIENGDDTRFQLIVSTAHPYKFLDCYREIFDIEVENDYQAAAAIAEKTAVAVPEKIRELEAAVIRFPKIIEKDEMISHITDFIKTGGKHE